MSCASPVLAGRFIGQGQSRAHHEVNHVVVHPVDFGTSLCRRAEALQAPAETSQDNNIKKFTAMFDAQSPVEQELAELPKFSPGSGYRVLDGSVV
eukprot:5194155-Amphidinium_carterae.1